MINYSDYKLWERELLFFDQDANKHPPQGKYSIVWEDPEDVDAPAKITTPSPQWLAMALYGGILPPVEVYWALKKDEAKPTFTHHTRGFLLHDTPPVKAMTEEEAMEYLVQKELPTSVWLRPKGNRSYLKIVLSKSIPTDRTFRNGWSIKQEK